MARATPVRTRQHRIELRLSDLENQALIQLAKAQNCSASQLLRSLILERHQNAPSTRTPSTPTSPDPEPAKSPTAPAKANSGGETRRPLVKTGTAFEEQVKARKLEERKAHQFVLEYSRTTVKVREV